MYARRWRETIWESTSVSSSPSKGTYHKRCEEWKTTEMASSHLENLYDERTWWNYNSLHCLKSASYENLTQVNTSRPSSSRQLLPKKLALLQPRTSLWIVHRSWGLTARIWNVRTVAWRLHNRVLFSICSTTTQNLRDMQQAVRHCELNWRKHIFRLLIPKYHLREMNEKYHLREMNTNSATENYYDNIQY